MNNNQILGEQPIPKSKNQLQMKKVIIQLTCLFGILFNLQAQEVLTLEEAVSIAMKNNLSIELEQYDLEIAQNNVTRGNAGQLPTIDLQGSYDYNYNLEQNVEEGDALALPEGQALGGNNLVSTTLQGSVTLNYVIFDGFQGRYRYQQLETQSDLAATELKQEMEEVYVDVLEAYFDVAKNQAQLSIDQQSIQISQERLQRNRIANEYSSANRIEILQAEVDLNEDSIDYENTVLAYDRSKLQLANLLNRSSDVNFSVEENISLREESFDYETLKNQMLESNATLELSQHNLSLAYQDLQLEGAQRYPTLSASAGMNYNRQANENSFPEIQETWGPGVGVTLSYQLYDGKQRKVKRKNAQLTVDRSQTNLTSTQQRLEMDLANAYRNYTNYYKQLQKNIANLESYERNFQKSQEDYGLGQTSGTDLRNAQVNLMNAKNRIAILTYDVKIAESNLLQLSGQLITNIK